MRVTVVAASIGLALIGISTADPSQAAIRKLTSISGQTLDPALRILAKDRQMQLLYASDLVRNQRTAGAAGELTFDEALTQLLAGTGLTFEYLDEQAVTIIPIATAHARQPAAVPTVLAEQEGQKTSFWSRFRLAQSDQGGGAEAVSPVAADSGASRAERPALEEVLVTAQKREERLKDVPISISVLNGDDLDQSTAQSVNEELTRVPGVAAFSHTQGGGTVVTVRGVTASGPVFAGSSPVSYYLDAVPFGLVQTAIAPDANAYDLARIEVLRGPQGTLYGASAQAGVVRVLTKDASLDRFELKGRASGSGTEDGGSSYRGDVALNVPIVEGKLAARAVVGYENLGGWIDEPGNKDANDAELRNARLKINAQPTEQLSIGLSAWLSRNDHGGLSASDDNQQRDATLDESYIIDYDAYGLKVSYDFGSFSLTSMTSYLDYSSGGDVDVLALVGAHLPLFTGFDADVFSQEINITSRQLGPWRVAGGAIYRDGEDRTLQGIPAILTLDWTNTSKSYAVFGELSRRFLNDRMEWTLGARYFHDEVASREDRAVAPANPPNYYRASDTFSATTPRAVLTWRPTDDLSVYGSYSEGFRSGTPQPYYVTNGVQGFPSVKPDKLHNFEVGAKGGAQWLSFEAALFYMDWKDVQQQLSVLFGTTPVSAIVNGKSASGLGADLAVTARPAAGLEVGAALSWNDLTMDADILSGGAVLFSKGDRANFSPQYTGGVFGSYSFPLGGGGYTSRFAVSGNYTSKQGFRSIVNGAQVLAYGEPILIARTSFSVQAPKSWEVTLYADNLTNEKDSVVGNPFFGPDAAVRVRPRTVGLQLEYRLE